MAACLVIAYKFNEPVYLRSHGEASEKDPQGKDPRLLALLAFIEQEWSVSQEAVWDAEVGVLVRLKFRLHTPAAHVATQSEASSEPLSEIRESAGQ